MKPLPLRDKGEIEAYLRGDTYLHLYGIGDLDDFFWEYTTWHALKENGAIRAIALLYTGQSLPTLLLLSDDEAPLRELAESIAPILPARFYARLSPGLDELFRARFNVEAHGPHNKMALTHADVLDSVDCSEVAALTESDLDDMLALYRESYPENWFDPRMLETGQYYGIRKDGRLLSAGGIHVYSERYRVAALGNITTLPEYRGNGRGAAVTASICRSLLRKVDHIGLNVKSDNAPALACYRKLGFEVIAPYGEFTLERK